MCTANLSTIEIDLAEAPKVNEEEVPKAARKIIEDEAPGLNSIPKEALKAAINIVPIMFTEAFMS